ncbi:MAG: class I SAM-dependent methyltransferase [Leptospiraceae bacterium]|nr:class I SAM-dependent methyltransferase [Leptospiraceae bacterium]
MKAPIPPLNCLCEGRYLKSLYHYSEPPPREIKFALNENSKYSRDLLKCSLCNHYISIHDMQLSSMYSENYVSSNYKDLEGIQNTFQKIINLPEDKSDNSPRVSYVSSFAKTFFNNNLSNRKVLDIGSGLCVFLYKMKELGWDCVALDPDQRSTEHAKINVGVEAICGDFMKLELMDKYDLITLNKVLEHVENPVEMLQKTKLTLKKDGLIYIEVPDGEIAETEGKNREEFTIDHPHNFSIASTALLVERAGLKVLKIERLQEPSTKFTIRVFIKKK